MSTNCCTKCINGSYSKLSLVFIEKIYGYDVIYDLIKGKTHVQNCLASDWLVYIYLLGHMIIVLNESDQLWLYDQNNYINK